MASNIASAAMWAAVFTPTADEIAKEIVAEEARLREIEEKAYWEAYWKAWDRGYKEKTIERLRNHEEGYWILTWNKERIYPNLTQDDIADLIESGELKIIDFKSLNVTVCMWADGGRKEAQNPLYIKYNEKTQEAMRMSKDYRII